MRAASVKSGEKFVDLLLAYYTEHGRHDLPWRLPESDGAFDPYKVLVSELMLQQTQVARVIPKYEALLREFPSVEALAGAPLGAVLVAWQGLGYNRRAKFLWQAAQKIREEFGRQLPNDPKLLEDLPGVGPNTAGAIRAYAFNEPAVFIETNIRTVYIHHFFKDQENISDSDILSLLRESLASWLGREQGQPRAFYWALMDYGSYLKQTVGNTSRASKTYAKQSKFSGSFRELRGRALKALASGAMDEAGLVETLRDERAAAVLEDLLREGLIHRSAGLYRLP